MYESPVIPHSFKHLLLSGFFILAILIDYKKPLDESERGEWKSWLKTQHSFKKLILWDPVPSLHSK